MGGAASARREPDALGMCRLQSSGEGFATAAAITSPAQLCTPAHVMNDLERKPAGIVSILLNIIAFAAIVVGVIVWMSR